MRDLPIDERLAYWPGPNAFWAFGLIRRMNVLVHPFRRAWIRGYNERRWEEFGDDPFAPPPPHWLDGGTK